LASHIFGMSGHGKRLLELGCGLGFPSLIAAQSGFEVLATDYYAEALEFLCLNAVRQGLRVPHTRVVDWREFPADLGTFDVVVAADVLYEKPMCGLIADAIRRSLKPRGEAIVSDPCRLLAAGFPDVCSGRGLSVDRVEDVPYKDGETKQTIRVYEVRHAPRLS
jgi:2-polyprenyl-3-methyl-5-hydroxy-6-metoxy-1,4-benzoquinol methylase